MALAHWKTGRGHSSFQLGPSFIEVPFKKAWPLDIQELVKPLQRFCRRRQWFLTGHERDIVAD